MEGMGGISENWWVGVLASGVVNEEEEAMQRTFSVMFWAVVPLVQKGEVLVVGGWDVSELDGDAGRGVEVFDCTIGGEGGMMGVEIGSVEVEVFDCVIGGGGVGGGGGITEPSTTANV